MRMPMSPTRRKEWSAIKIHTTIDGNPTNNFLERTLAFNPDGVLHGAKQLCFVGTLAYVFVAMPGWSSSRSTIRSIHRSLEPCRGTATQCGNRHRQFRYAFVCCRKGLVILDITPIGQPR